MQYRGVIGVLDVLEIELPVVRQDLRAAADHVKRPVQHALQAADDQRAEIGFEILDVLVERAEHQAAQFGDPQPLQVVLLLAELGRHAALAA